MTPQLFWALVSLAVLPTLYFLPSLIAWRRGVVRLPVLIGFNLIAGFTGIGWLFTLGWAVGGATMQKRRAASPMVVRQQPARLDQDARLRAAMGLDRMMVPTGRWPTSSGK